MDSLRSIFVTLLLFLLIFQGVFVGRADSLAFEQDGLSNVFLQMKINTTDDAKNILSSAIIAIFGYLDTIQDAELEKTCIKFNETVSPMPTIQEAESFKEKAFLLCMEKVTDLWFWLDFILSITVVVLVEEVIPNAIYKRYGVAMALRCFYLVHILMMITYPISYSFTKLLDLIVGKESATLYTRNELKAVTSVNGIQAGNGGDLLQDEIAEIHGILDSIEKVKRLLAAFYFLLQDEEAAFKTGLHILNIKRLLTEIPRVKQNDSVRDCLEHLTQEKALFALVMETLPDGGRPIGVISLVDVVKAIFMVDVGRDEKKLWVLEEPKLLSK
ncbi:hypothetical protein COCNU_scaffold002618G000010 [Cocos nucifera]|nr:hypothetical protein [Cocos nucifera]